MYKINNKNVKLLEPKDFGLHPRTVLGQLDDNLFVIIKDRKSRIIMKDGRQILEQIDKLKGYRPESEVSLATNAPVCSKTIKFLAEKGIDILQLK